MGHGGRPRQRATASPDVVVVGGGVTGTSIAYRLAADGRRVLLLCPFGTNFDKEYGRQTPSGQILCGGFRRLDAGEGLGTTEERTTPAVLSGIARCLTELFPVLRGGGIRVVRAWAGIMGFTADGLPLIGRYPPAPGLTLAAGFNGGGFSWGAIVGRVVADLLADRDPGFDLAPFRPDRFAGAAGPAWRNPFTAGERSGTASVAVPAVR